LITQLNELYGASTVTLAFQDPNIIYIFHCLDPYKIYVQERNPV